MSLLVRAPRHGRARHGVIEFSEGTVRARVRPWNGSSDRAFLVLTAGHDESIGLPDAVEVDRWLCEVAAAGYRDVRTNALAPRVAEVFRGAGCSELQSLVMLSRPLDGNRRGVPRGTRVRSMSRRRVAAPRSRTARAVVACDTASFPDEWTMDLSSLRDALAATAVSRLFVVDGDSGVDGFLVAGSTGRTGYIQRLAVVPDRRRRGHADALLAASLEWLGSVGCRTAVVNTEDDNTAALALYEGRGFLRVGSGLVVMGRTW